MIKNPGYNIDRFDINAVVHASQVRSYWTQSITGVWSNATSVEGSSTSNGILVLYESGGQVIGFSTTSDSKWTGTWDVTKKILNASYVNKYDITGTLVLKLSSDGSKISGTWSATGGSGIYKAFRQPVHRTELLQTLSQSPLVAPLLPEQCVIKLNINVVVQMTQKRDYWPATITGLWDNAKSAQLNSQESTGVLALLEKNGKVVGCSTTNDSLWSGNWYPTQRRLIVYYINKYKCEGTIDLRLSEDGSTISGTWQSINVSGVYSATRSTNINYQSARNWIENSTMIKSLLE